MFFPARLQKGWTWDSPAVSIASDREKTGGIPEIMSHTQAQSMALSLDPRKIPEQIFQAIPWTPRSLLSILTMSLFLTYLMRARVEIWLWRFGISSILPIQMNTLTKALLRIRTISINFDTPMTYPRTVDDSTNDYLQPVDYTSQNNHHKNRKIDLENPDKENKSRE